MRTLAITTTVTLTLAGCANATTPMPGSPPVRHLALARLAEEPAHDDALPLDLAPNSVDRSDPESVAAALIVAGLAEQGLQIVDLGVHTLTSSPAAATVRVAATHLGTGAQAAHTSVYELDLARDAEASSWHLVDFRQAH